MTSLRQVEYSQLGLLSESVHRLLSEKECAIFDRGLADYHRRRNVKNLVECLSLVLTTGQKRKLLIPIRDVYVKPSDLSKFNQLVQAHGLATSHRQRIEEKVNIDGVRKLEVKRDTDGQWGFSIRGGSEHGIGIFVSWIEPGTNAEKSGLQVGDQILKANDTSLEKINHYDAVMLMKNAKKLRLFVVAHGRIPGSRMAHKVYHWVDPEGRPTTPPPDPFEIQDNSRNGEFKLLNEADERKVTVIIDKGKELGISIRGGIEHGLGIYISSVETDSIAESYGLKVGDQILEVNGTSFLGVVHSDAANALRAQSCMVMKIKDVGKLPYSRLTAYSQTKWYPTSQESQEIVKTSPTPVFRPGVGSQVMLGQQQDNLLKGHGLLKDVAQSVLTEQEQSLFMYYLNQYQHYDMPINELLPPVLTLLDTPEKLQLLTELRALIKPQDIQQYNELTVHKEIMAKKYHTQPQIDADMSNRSLDVIPQKLSPQRPTHDFHVPPPPTSKPPPTQQMIKDDWNDQGLGSIFSGHNEDSSLIEERIRTETETKLKNKFLEKEKMIIEEQKRLLEEERADKEATLHREREKMEKEMKEREEHIKAEIEDRIRIDMEQEQSILLAKKEQELEQERERWMQEEREKEEQIRLMQEKTKEELEERIWKEAEEHLREEYEAKRQQEKEASLQRRSKVSEKAAAWDVEGRIRRDLENKIRKEYEDKLKLELRKLKQQEEKEKQQRDEALQQKIREEQIARLEAEEQSRIEMEEKIRRETEAKVRSEFESRLQQETEERARLAEEVKVRKAAEERLQNERIELEREREKEKKALEVKVQKAAEEKLQNKRLELEREREKKVLERKQQEEKDKQEAKREREAELRTQKVNEEPDESDEPDGFPLQEEDGAPDFALEKQRLARLNQEKESERIRQEEINKAKEELKRQENEKLKKKELERRREENIRKREEERKQKELESKKIQDTAPKERNREPFSTENDQDKNQSSTVNSKRIKVNFGEDESGSLIRRKKKAKEDTIENERRKAEEKLQRRLKRAQEKKKSELKSFAGFTDLEGEILHIKVTKVVKKLGIAIDGGANTKQKAVIIREISPEGCAALTGMGMAVNQQVLQVNGNSLFGLRHREVVMQIKTAFDGPMNKVIEFVVLDPN